MSKTILVVDDSPLILKVLEKRLRTEGFEVLTAATCTAALTTARAEQPDLVLLDILLPDGNGFEVCKTLKEDELTKDIPVVMLTALTSESDLTEGLEAGATCFISKPFNPIDLVDEIHLALGET